ncbi:hypothetical protein Tco_0772344 [Tanacetum coccineum]|uniref:Uncharacterized protein n=1 Tax=Tanacetum coccineum TaxID=301880 RepID=A0ABQ4ZLM3_9ASTR
MSSLASFFLRLGFSADLLVLLFLLAYLCRGATSGPSRKWTLLFLSPNRVKTSLSLGPSLVNTVVLTRLLRRVGLSLSCFSLENTRAVREECVPLDAVTGLCLLLLGLFFLSRDSDSEDWDLIVMFFANFPKLVRGETLRITTGCLLTPLAGCVPDCEGFLLRKITPLALPQEGDPAIKLGCESKRVSLSDAWVMGRGSPFYPVDNKVVDVRSTDVDVLARCPNLYLLLFLAWSRVTICRSLPLCVGHVPCGAVGLMLLVAVCPLYFSRSGRCLSALDPFGSWA